jgi:SAM-dependent methyltransferase
MSTEYYRGDPKYKDTVEFQVFQDKMNAGEPKKILEVGVARSNPNVCTHHEALFTNVKSYVKTDFQDDGIDVDIVSDIHRLEDTFDTSSFDGVLARSVYEHVEKPWVASASINKVLKLGGLAHIDTHLTFPIHGYPNDYFRFTTDGLVSLFDDSFGFKVMACDHYWPVSLVFSGNQQGLPVWDEYAAAHRNFLHVSIVAKKIKDV